MSTRARLETVIAELQEKIDNLPADTPKNVRDALEQEMVDRSIELNTYVDVDDNNE